MTQPRQVLPDRSYLITRRCTQRQFLLRPDRETNNAFAYCLAVAAQKYDVDVLFSLAMSNHHHTGIHDKHGNFPEFVQYFHRLLAASQNALRGRWENFWSNEKTSVVLLLDAEDVLREMAYTLCNPVKAALVQTAGEWPGFSSYNAMLSGEALLVRRPKHFFRPDGPLPEEISLEFAIPPEFDDLDQDSWGTLVRERVQAKEKEHGRTFLSERVRVLGVRKVLRQRWDQFPKSAQARGSLSPRVAGVNKWRRIEALRANRQFLRLYRLARDALSKHVEDVIFPAGTYWLRRFLKVRCQPLQPHLG